MPILHEPMKTLLSRYPDVRSGLGGIDERVLRAVADFGPRTFRVTASACADDDTADRQYPDYLLYRLCRMADQETPLVTLTGRPTFDFAMPFPEQAKRFSEIRRDFKVTLTAFGKAVLAGEANAVHENGIDEWIGGVHLTDAEAPPFREGRTLLLG